MKRLSRGFWLAWVAVIVLAVGVPPSHGGTTIEFWDVNTRAPHVAAFDQLKKDFEKETGIAVKKSIFSTRELMTQIAAAKASGTLPDVIFADYGDTQSVSMGLMGVAAPVTDIIAEKGEKFWVHPIFIKRASFNAQTWGVP